LSREALLTFEVIEKLVLKQFPLDLCQLPGALKSPIIVVYIA
jgi:hypothetical protein